LRLFIILIIFQFTIFEAVLPVCAQVKLGGSTGKVQKIEIDYANPKTYEIGGIDISGIRFLDQNALIAITDLKVGDEIEVPGPKITNAIKKLWDQNLLGDIEVGISKIEGRYIFLEFILKEKPRLSKFQINGVKKGEADDVREKIQLIRGKIVSDALIRNTQNTIRKFFTEKGYLNADVKIVQRDDSTLSNSVILVININKKTKVKIKEIQLVGNNEVPRKTVLKKLKDTKEKNPWRIFKASRFIKSKFEADKERLIEYYNKNGYRDAQVVFDSVYAYDDKTVILQMQINEGQKYYFRNIEWKGNYLYNDDYLNSLLGIKKGDVYNMELLQRKLNYNPLGYDISSLYMDDGYLFFTVDPVEVSVEKDSIDVEIRINEGQQATINKVTVQGNTKTNDHVILRELKTVPGQKFSRADIIRTQRELAQLGYFDPEKIGINPVPNPADGTVDINYTLEEKPSDQIELSGGWGGFFGFVGTLGLSFNNFSIRKINKLNEWSPLPSGDGQRFAIRFQANGRAFQTYNISFTEPWFGGRKPTSFTFGLNRSVQRGFSGFTRSEVNSRLAINGFNVSIGKRLRWPDDYFTVLYSANVQQYDLFNYRFLSNSDFGVKPTKSNSFAFTTTLARNSINNPTFPTAGSSLSLAVTTTPPFSLFRKDNNFSSDVERFKLIEYHKWMFDASWFTPIAKNFVINTRSHFGFLGNFNQSMGITPFERFRLGGSGIAGFNFLLGYDIIGLRGYNDVALSTPLIGGENAGVLFSKFVIEPRFAVSTNPAATIFVLGFLEGGNNWLSYKDYNPFNIYRSAGVGARIFMPAFGLIGVDFGKAFDGPSSVHQVFTFTIGQQIR
jgi:outer membrane protein insertion porin family